MITKILVTGSNGQLAKCIKELSINYKDVLDFTFVSKAELNIANKTEVEVVFSQIKFNYCINCAAYTNVEAAEVEVEEAFNINAEAVKTLAQVCKTHQTILIHPSTDYVFDGKKQAPYLETDVTNPINQYGKSKRLGELYIQETLNAYYIIRTSWLYSKYQKNFVKTIQKLAKEKTKIKVIQNQIGSPTNAVDLADCILKIIESASEAYGIFHFSNSGAISWYQFAKEIIDHVDESIAVQPIESKAFKTRAERPNYTVLNTNKIHDVFKLKKKDWKQSLKTYFNKSLKNL